MEEKKVVREKPKFLRKDWHKKIKLGRGVKKKMKWRFPRGRHNKIRLSRKGHGKRPKIGWGGSDIEIGLIRVENMRGLEGLKKGDEIIIGSMGAKKRKEIIAKANEMKIKILNKYKEKNESS